MLISCNWLSRHVDLDGVDLHDLGRRFTLAVAELEEVIEVGHGLDPVVVGKVLEVHPIEGAKIRRTLVDVGLGEPQQIVCGAPNVAEGQLVVVALPGAKVGDLEIRKAAIRGVESSGMICSEKELGISDSHDGIMVLNEGVVGESFAAQFGVADTLFEIDNKSLTHRPDLWGHRGIAREIAALLDRPLKPMDLDVAFTDARPLSIDVQDLDRCPRYSAVTMDNITVKPSPLWLRMLLHRVGTRPISNIVDATNFVMLDLGNPLHAFDRRQIAGDSIVVRRAQAGETFVTLDGQERKLSEDDLLIGDAERGVALAGVMGGENSEIRDDSSSIVLEAAAFDAAAVRLTSQRLGLRTESSARFEKSLDPKLPEAASRAFCKLVAELVPEATVTSAFMDVAAPYPEPLHITLRPSIVRSKLGVADLATERIERILKGLEFGVTPQGDDALDILVPTFRATKDIGLEIDLVEEIGRVYGYDNIVPQSAQVQLRRPHKNAQKNFERRVRQHLSRACGFDEVLTYPFDFDPHLERIKAVDARRLLMANPISQEMKGLKRHLAPNLLLALERNDRDWSQVDIFEIGRVFQTDTPTEKELPAQPTTLGVLTSVDNADASTALTFRVLKGLISGLALAVERGAIRLEQGGVDHVWCHPVRQARIFAGDVVIGYMAQLHPATAHTLDLRKGEAAVMEIDLDAWRNTPKAAAGYTPLPRFPAVFRDFAVVVDESVRASAIQEAIASVHLVSDVTFQSVYRGKGVDEGKKSMAWSVTARHADHTLGDEDVKRLEDGVWKVLAERVGGVPRA